MELRDELKEALKKVTVLHREFTKQKNNTVFGNRM